MLDKNMTRDMGWDTMDSPQRMTTGDSSGEDIDEIAFRYVLGVDGTSRNGTMPIEEEHDITMIGAEEAQLDVQELRSKDGTSPIEATSWRDAVQSDETTAFKHERTTERNMKLMSDLWNRLFPIDYEAIPVPAYVVMEEEFGNVPVIAQDASSPTTDTGTAASAKVAGLGLGTVSALFDRHHVLKSDTSNEDTVMIGNTALSEMLSHHQYDATTAQTSEETSDSETPEEPVEDEPLPEVLTSLYDEAMSMFVEPEPEDDASATPQEASNISDDNFEDVNESDFQDDDSMMAERDSDMPAISEDEDDISDDVDAPADAENIQTDYVSDDYREDTGSTNIYESEEWLQIEREIEETNRAVEAGLNQLDALAHVGLDNSAPQPAEREDVAPVVTADDAPSAHEDAETTPAYDADDFTDVPEPADLIDAQTVEESDVTPWFETATMASVARENQDESAQSESTSNVQQIDEQPARQGIFTRIAHIFQKHVPSQPVTYNMEDEDIKSDDLVRDSEPIAESTYGTAPAVSHEEDSSSLGDAGIEQDVSSAHYSEDWETHSPNVVISDDATEDRNAGAQEGDSAEEVVEIGDDYRASNGSPQMPNDSSIGTDYRQTGETPEDGIPSPDDTFFGMEPIELESDEDTKDDLVQMLDDEYSQDYRAEASDANMEDEDEPDTSAPTMPMSQDEIATSETMPAPQTVPQRPEGVIRPHGTVPQEIRRIDKNRLRNLQLDASPDLMLPLPTSRNGQINANVKIKTTEFLNPKKNGVGARSSYIKLSVRPSKVRMSSVTLLPEGTGYVPEESPIGTRLREQARYEYEPIRRIGEPIDA